MKKREKPFSPVAGVEYFEVELKRCDGPVSVLVFQPLDPLDMAEVMEGMDSAMYAKMASMQLFLSRGDVVGAGATMMRSSATMQKIAGALIHRAWAHPVWELSLKGRSNNALVTGAAVAKELYSDRYSMREILTAGTEIFSKSLDGMSTVKKAVEKANFTQAEPDE